MSRLDAGGCVRGPTLTPNAPRGLPAVPELLQDGFVSKGIHILPVAPVVVDSELIFGNELAHRLLLPNRVIAFDEVEDTRLEDEKPSVDEVAVRSGLLPETFDARLIRGNIERSKATRLSNSCNGSQRGLLAVKLNERGNVEIADAVAIGQAESFVAYVLANTLDASTRHGVQTGIDKGDTPRLGGCMMYLNRIVAQVDREIGVPLEVFQEVFLQEMAFVAAANDKIIQSMMRVELHDVPDDRKSSDLDKRLRNRGCLFADTGSVTACKYNNFHHSAPPSDILISIMAQGNVLSTSSGK